MGAAGDTPYAMVFGGHDSGYGINSCETWNGSSWTEQANLSTARMEMAGGGKTGTDCVAMGGYVADAQWPTGSEEWTVPEALKTLASTNA